VSVNATLPFAYDVPGGRTAKPAASKQERRLKRPGGGPHVDLEREHGKAQTGGWVSECRREGRGLLLLLRGMKVVTSPSMVVATECACPHETRDIRLPISPLTMEGVTLPRAERARASHQSMVRVGIDDG
jgi:hypothetical protein